MRFDVVSSLARSPIFWGGVAIFAVAVWVGQYFWPLYALVLLGAEIILLEINYELSTRGL